MSAVTALQHLTVPAVKKHTATVIFVHGLGDTGYGWKPVADIFKADSAMGHIKWVLPHSPERPVTANMGMVMPSWFDIKSFGFKDTEDEAGMLETVASLTQLIDTEVAGGLQPDRIILGGFSQGSAMSLLTGLTIDKQLAGVAALSGWVPIKNKFRTMASAHATKIPIFWGHGAADPLVKIPLAQESIEFLKTLGISVSSGVTGEPKGLSYNVYTNVGHSTNNQELEDLKTWIKKVIPDQ